MDAPCTIGIPATADSTISASDQPPELVGGLERLSERLSYPELARRAGIEGTVCLQFIVDEQGAVQDVEVVRSAHPLLDREATRVVEASAFRPGSLDGVAVKTRLLLPVAFRLRDGAENVVPILLGVTAALAGVLVLLILLDPNSQR